MCIHGGSRKSSWQSFGQGLGSCCAPMLVSMLDAQLAADIAKAILGQVHGPEHPDVAAALHALAGLKDSRG